MSQIVEGKEHPSGGVSKCDCHKSLNPHPSSKEYMCMRMHREEAAHVGFDAYDKWMQKHFSKHHDSLRFGQDFCNEFDVHDEGLFYERNPVLASHAIWTHYIVDGTDYYTPQWDHEGKIL